MLVKGLCVGCAPQRVRYQLSLQLALECALRGQLVRLGCYWSRRRPCLCSVLIRNTFTRESKHGLIYRCAHETLLHGTHLSLTCMHVNSGIQSLRQQTCLHCLQGSSDGEVLGPHVARPRQAQVLRLRRLHRQLLPWLRRAAAQLLPPRMRACAGAQRLGSASHQGCCIQAHSSVCSSSDIQAQR